MNCSLSEEEKYRIFSLYYKKTYNAAFFISKSKELAEDATQEAFIRAFKYYDTLKDKTKVGAWLATISINISKDLLKDRWKFFNITSFFRPSHQTAQILEDVEKKLFVKELLNGLSTDHKEILVLRFLYDLSLQEIAELLNISIGTVKSRLNRAKAQMLKIVNNNNDLAVLVERGDY